MVPLRRTTGMAARPMLIASGKTYATSSVQAITSAMLRRPAKVIPDYLTPMPSHLLNTTLNDLLTTSLPSSPKILSNPSSLSPAHQLVYFPIQTAPSALAPDGADPDHSPGPPFSRRMWAGGELNFRKGWENELILDGRPWVCRESIEDVKVKGLGGQEKIFVEVWRKYGVGHEIEDLADRIWQIEERRTLVFMRKQEVVTEVGSSTSPPRMIKYPHPPTISTTITPTRAHLFHFSALTFNAHTIHLDSSHAKTTDGHRDLLVHGPLTLALMLRQLEQEGIWKLKSVVYRNHAPLYVGESLKLCARKLEDAGSRWDVWVERPDGGLAVKGTVEADVL